MSRTLEQIELENIRDVLGLFRELSQTSPTPSCTTDMSFLRTCLSSPMPEEHVVATKIPDVHASQYRFLNWAEISKEPLTSEQYFKYAAHLDWDLVSQHISAEMALIFHHKINWDVFIRTHPVGLAVLSRLNIPAASWSLAAIVEHQPLTAAELDNLLFECDAATIAAMLDIAARTQTLDELFMLKHEQLLDWEVVFMHQALSRDFYNRNKHRVSEMFLEVFARPPK